MRYDIDSINKRKGRAKTLKIIVGIVLIVIIYNIILIGISMVDGIDNFSIFGYQAYIITSDSMKPEINNGDVVIVRKIGQEEIKENDVIVYSEEAQNITHRVIVITEKNGHKEYKTKGDNNQVEDSKFVLYENIKGKVMFKIPFLGTIILFMKNQIIVLIILLVILLFCLYKMQKNDKNELRRRKKESDKKQ